MSAIYLKAISLAQNADLTACGSSELLLSHTLGKWIVPLVSSPNHPLGLLLFPASEAGKDQELPSLWGFTCVELWFCSSGRDASKYFTMLLYLSSQVVRLILAKKTAPKHQEQMRTVPNQARGRAGRLS